MNGQDKFTTCPSCKARLKIAGAGRFRCPACNAIFEVSDTPAPQPQAAQKSGYCEFHPTRLATSICQVCGTLICAECVGEKADYPTCPRCRGTALRDEPINNPKSYLADLKDVLFKPQAFFSSITPKGNIGRALIFGVFWATVGNFVAGIWSYKSFKGLFERFGSGVDISTIFGSSFYIGSLIGSIIGNLILIFLATLVIHLCLLIFGGAKQGLEATLKGLAYAQSTYIWSAVPFLGALIVPTWWLVCATIALKNLHKTTTSKALLAILAPVIVVMILLIVAVMMFVAFFAKTFGSFFQQIPI